MGNAHPVHLLMYVNFESVGRAVWAQRLLMKSMEKEEGSSALESGGKLDPWTRQPAFLGAIGRLASAGSSAQPAGGKLDPTICQPNLPGAIEQPVSQGSSAQPSGGKLDPSICQPNLLGATEQSVSKGSSDSAGGKLDR